MQQWLDRWLHDTPDGLGLWLSDSERVGECEIGVKKGAWSR
jgi:hypothetical protein